MYSLTSMTSSSLLLSRAIRQVRAGESGVMLQRVGWGHFWQMQLSLQMKHTNTKGEKLSNSFFVWFTRALHHHSSLSLIRVSSFFLNFTFKSYEVESRTLRATLTCTPFLHDWVWFEHPQEIPDKGHCHKKVGRSVLRSDKSLCGLNQ